MTGSIALDLQRIFDPAYRATYEREVGTAAGLSRKRVRRFADFDGCHGESADGGLHLRCERDGAACEFAVQALGLPDDWEPYAELRLDLEAGDADLRVGAMVMCREQRLVQRFALAAGERRTVGVPLDELALANQSRDPDLPLYTVIAIKLQVQWGDSWPDEDELLIAGGTWPATADNPPTSLRVHGAELVPYPAGRDPVVYDRFGQCRLADPATLVRADAELVADREAEAAELAAMQPPAGRSRYGGLVGGLRFEPGGFFRVERDADGRWWYVDPEGHPYWGFGFCCTGTGESRIILEPQKRLYAELPDPDGPWGSAVIPRPYPGPDGRVVRYPAVSFYHWNVLRKYGDIEAWTERMLERLTRWGVNAIGNWSVGPMSEQRTVPHCRALMARLDTIPRVSRGFPDVFHPDWPAHFDRAIAGELAAQRDNPWLIGWFCDNEMPWGGLDKGAIFRGTGPDAPVRREFARFMAARYGELAAFNRDFATTCADWDELRGLEADAIPADGDGAAAMAAFAAHFAERYFSVVAATIRKHDPNHLYLGCRFVRNMPHPDIVAACGRHADVLSVNCYDLWPREETFRAWHESAGGLPIQLGEFGLPGAGDSSVRPDFPVFGPETIGRLAAEMGEKWSRQPWSIGVHWFPWQALCGELDRPSPPFVAAIRTIARELPRWRGVV